MREGDIDDLNTEFNKTNPLFRVKSRFVSPVFRCLKRWPHIALHRVMKYDNETGCRQQWDYGEGVFGSEAVYAPRAGATREDAEDDGYVVTVVTNSRDWSSTAWSLMRPTCSGANGSGHATPAGTVWLSCQLGARHLISRADDAQS